MVAKSIKRVIRKKETILFLVTLVVVMGFYINNRHFLSPDALRGTMNSMVISGIMAVGVALLFIGGGIDLSMMMLCTFGGVICAIFIRDGVPWGFAIILTLMVAACIGAINAFFITRLGIMHFIVTIAISSIIQGVNLFLTNIQNVPITVESFYWGSNVLFGIFPYPFVIMVILLLLYGLMLRKTQFGRNIYLVGGNEHAARLAGISIAKVRTILYINASVLAAFSGIVLASMMRSASPSATGDNQMDAITAAMLGGIAFGGGSGGMLGCFIGILMLNFLSSGLTSLALRGHWTTIAQGALLILALTVDFLSERARHNALIAGASKKGV